MRVNNSTTFTRNFNGEAIKPNEVMVPFEYTELEAEKVVNPECIRTIETAGQYFKVIYKAVPQEWAKRAKSAFNLVQNEALGHYGISNSVSMDMLEDEYALLQKTITTNLLEKKREINNGLAPQYYVEDSHEAIIPRDLFMRVQEEMVRRANLRSGEDGKKKRIYSSKYALSSLCTCEKCGDVYRRIAWNNRGKKYTVWRCCTRVEHGPGECDAPTIVNAVDKM